MEKEYQGRKEIIKTHLQCMCEVHYSQKRGTDVTVNKSLLSNDNEPIHTKSVNHYYPYNNFILWIIYLKPSHYYVIVLDPK